MVCKRAESLSSSSITDIHTYFPCNPASLRGFLSGRPPGNRRPVGTRKIVASAHLVLPPLNGCTRLHISSLIYIAHKDFLHIRNPAQYNAVRIRENVQALHLIYLSTPDKSILLALSFTNLITQLKILKLYTRLLINFSNSIVIVKHLRNL